MNMRELINSKMEKKERKFIGSRVDWEMGIFVEVSLNYLMNFIIKFVQIQLKHFEIKVET